MALPARAIAPPPARPAVVAPLAPERYRVQVTASAETYATLRLAQDLLCHQIPDGDLGQVLDRALTALVQELARKKLAATAHPRGSRGTAPGSRHVPAAVRRAVWRRDGGRCAFVSQAGCRCTERGCLEFHHVTPYAAGGEATAGNIPRPPWVVREPGGSYSVPREPLPAAVAARSTRSGPSCGLGRAAALDFSGRGVQPRAGADG